MSVIAGVYRFNGDAVQQEDKRLFMHAMGKYPADQRGVWDGGRMMLASHAQWITEQSVHEQLPFYDSKKRLAITADAIIDNREELMDELQVSSVRRSDIADSELLLLAYDKWSERMTERLVGDFAFAIWDEKRQLLFCARDFSGSRTLYYHKDAEQFSFCTMTHPLLSLPHVHKQLNEQWLAEFLAIKGVFEPPDVAATVYKNIYQLPPSHTLIVSNNRILISKYSSLSEIAPIKLSSPQEYEEGFREVFHKAVTARLKRTRRHIGAHLSGGLDSGSVVSFAARALQESNRQLHTFSYVPDEGFVDWTPKRRLADERPLIQQTVKYVGNIEDNYLSFSGSDPYTEIDDWLDILESPYKFFDNTFWLRGFYEQSQQRGIGILLNGARGNYSISWGPALDYYSKLVKRLQWYRLSREIKQYSKNVGAGRKTIYSIVGRKAFSFVDRLKPTPSPYEFPQLIHSDFAKRTGIYEKLSDPKFTGIGSTADLPSDPLEARKLHFDRINVWSTTGTSGSKLSVRYSVWGHDPTNDLRVIRFCLGTPIEQFVQDGMDRALIRRSTKGWLPDAIRLNQRTRGIQAADSIHRMSDKWPMIIQEVEQLSRDSRMKQLLNMPVIEEALTQARNGLDPSEAYGPSIKVLLRSIILYRFLQKNF